MNGIFETGIEGVCTAETLRWHGCLENVAPERDPDLLPLLLEDLASLFGRELALRDYRMWHAAIGDLTPPRLQAGFRWAARNCKSMPTPAEVREHASRRFA
jgi:hypothetical protein